MLLAFLCNFVTWLMQVQMVIPNVKFFLHVDFCSGYCTICVYVVDYSYLSTDLYLFVLTTVHIFFFVTIFCIS